MPEDDGKLVDGICKTVSSAHASIGSDGQRFRVENETRLHSSWEAAYDRSWMPHEKPAWGRELCYLLRQVHRCQKVVKDLLRSWAIPPKVH